MTTIPEAALRLLKAKEFDHVFFNNLKICKTQMEAYEMTEKLFHEFFGKNKYRNFESFRKSRDSRLKVTNSKK